MSLPKTNEEAEAATLEWINEDLLTQSLLYDLDLMPEQLKKGTYDWSRMVIIAYHMQASYRSGKVEASP